MKIALTIGAGTTETHCGDCQFRAGKCCEAFGRYADDYVTRISECLAAESAHAAELREAREEMFHLMVKRIRHCEEHNVILDPQLARDAWDRGER